MPDFSTDAASSPRYGAIAEPTRSVCVDPVFEAVVGTGATRLLLEPVAEVVNTRRVVSGAVVSCAMYVDDGWRTITRSSWSSTPVNGIDTLTPGPVSVKLGWPHGYPPEGFGIDVRTW
jgi:hypothetical protein